MPRGKPIPLRATPAGASVTAIIILASFGFSLAANWPGHLTYDSVTQLLEGRTAIYANWHPPVMSWMLGLADTVLPGAGLFVAFDCLLAYGALASLLFLHKKASWAAAAVALISVLSPQFLIYPAIVWKDVLFAVLAVAGFVCLAHAARRWSRLRLRLGLVAGGLLFFVLAALARQNGILAPICGTLTLGWIAADAAPVCKLRSGAAYGGAALAVALLAIAAGHAALDARVTGKEGPASQIRLLQGYDIIGAVAAEPGLKLAQLRAADPMLEKSIRSDGVRLYSPERNDTLEGSPVLMRSLNDAPPGAIAAEWRTLVFQHPWLYLKTRWAAFRWVFFTPVLARCYPYSLGVDGPPDAMKTLGLARRWDARDAALANYASHYEGTPVFSHPAYALVAIAALVLLLRRRRPADIAMAGMLAAALLFAASFFAISIACDYRYLYVLDLSALVAVFYLALDPQSLLASGGREWRPREDSNLRPTD